MNMPAALSDVQRADLLDRVDRAIAEREDELIEIVQELVRRPSLLGEEAEVQAYVADYLRANGVETESWDIDDALLEHPDAGSSGVPFAGRPNVTGTTPGDGTGRSLILNGHIDVVSPEPLSAWNYDPWEAKIVDRRMYGRGAYDMKSGVAMNMFLTTLFPRLGITLGGDLSIHSVIEEECTGNGALAASLRQRADAAIVTESVNQEFTFAHLGVLWFKVAVSGVSAHAAWAWQGVNAISKMTPITQALEELDRQLNQERHPIWANEPHPINLNIGIISGGDWPSMVPGACEIHCRVSYYPGQTPAEMRARIEQAVGAAVATDPWFEEHPPVISYDGFSTRGSIIDWEEPIVQLVEQHHRRITGEKLIPNIGNGVNDMRYYNFVGVPSGCYGAKGADCHAADEWLDLDSMVPATRVLAGFVLDWCGVAAD